MGLQLVIEDLEGSTTVVPLGEVPITIGRREGNTIQLTEQNVSRDHARLLLKDDGWQIEDLGSYNGVLVNAVPIQGRVSLAEGDQILIGDYQLALLDDNDRRTVDLGMGLRAANADMSITHAEPAMVPTGPLATLPPQTARPSDADSDDDGRRGGAGWLVAGLLGALVLAGGGYVAVQQGLIPGVGPYGAGQGPTKVAKNPTPAAGDADAGVQVDGDGEAALKGPAEVDAGSAGNTTSAGGTNDTAGVPEVESGSADGGAAVQAGSADGAETTTSDGATTATDSDGTEQAPAPDNSGQVTKKVPKSPSKPPMTDEEAASLLQQAQDVALSDPASAYALAKKSYDGKKSSKALMIMGTAACKEKWADKATAAQKKMGETDADKLASLCSNYGIELAVSE